MHEFVYNGEEKREERWGWFFFPHPLNLFCFILDCSIYDLLMSCIFHLLILYLFIPLKYVFHEDIIFLSL